jgi:uncharacterized membrane protein YgcG
MTNTIVTRCGFAAILLAAATAAAQTPASPNADSARWAPWMGCWQISEESVQDVERLLDEAATAAPRTRGARVCVTPSAEGGATLTTLVNGKPVNVETIVADGQSHPLADPQCRGTQRAEWSALAPRIYARTEVSCDNQPARVVSGLSAIVTGPVWVDIQLVESQGRQSVRVRRYRRALNQEGAPPAAARQLHTMPLAGRFQIADIKEASAKLPAEAVQAAVYELGPDGYDLNAKRLIELDEAGVPDAVIDLMVALSFPEKFVVERAVSGGGTGPAWGGLDSELWGPYSMWPYYYAHPRYYSSYYSPFNYGYWGYYNPYYYGLPGVIVIDPGGERPNEPSGNGRVVDGRGYTRVRPNVPAPGRTGDSGSPSGASSSSSSSRGGSNSGGSVSTGGYSGGGSGGGGGGRVAVPRPPGGN